MKSRKWTKKERNFLKENYSVMSNKELAKLLNRTCYAIQTAAHTMKLKKEYLNVVKPSPKVMEKNNDFIDFIVFTLLIGNLIAIIINIVLTIIGG